MIACKCSGVFTLGEKMKVNFDFNSLLFIQKLLVNFFNTLSHGLVVLKNFIWVNSIFNNSRIIEHSVFKGVFVEHLRCGLEL